MKTTELKNMIKGAVKEAIQEELKDILLEAVRAPRISNITPTVVQESVTPTQQQTQTPQLTPEDKRAAYKNILGEMGNSFTSNNVPQKFNPAGADSINGSLPAGEVDMSQIAGLLGKR